MRPPVPYDTSGEVWVRPPALLEAAAGARATARFVSHSAVELGGTLASSRSFGAAERAYVAWAQAWRGELELLLRQAGELGAAVEAAAADYLRTDAVAVGAT